MLCIGLTGNIASGKSTVAKEFANFGIDIISADIISRELTVAGSFALNAIVDYFGKDILLNDGNLNRGKLREIIFSNVEKKLWLENLLHPLIRDAIYQKTLTLTNKYCVIEIPILPQKKDYPYINRFLLVIANEDQQIQRLIQRDAISKEEALKILSSQASKEEYCKIADDIIMNDNNLKQLKKHVLMLHEKYSLLADHFG